MALGGTVTMGNYSVARIGYGAMQLVERRGAPAVPRDIAVAVLRRAVRRGVNHIDTAHFYGAGACNALIRAALAPYDETLVLVSKVGAENGTDGLVPAQRPEQLRAQVEQNLAELGIDRLPVVNLRRLDAPPGIVAEAEQRVDLDSQLAELIALRDAGKIGGIGLSAVDQERLRAALPAGVVCVQNGYSLVDRTSEPVLELCRTHGIAWVPFFPLGSGFPGLPKVVDRPGVIAAAKASGATPAQVGLAWQLANYERTLLIPGTADLEHLEQNLAAGDLTLDAETLRGL